MPTNVLLVDHSRVVLTGNQRILANHPDINVVGAVSTLEQGIRAAEEFLPDVTVFDLSMADRGPSSRKQTQTLIESSKTVLCISLLSEDDISRLLVSIGVSKCLDEMNLSRDPTSTRNNC
jgi:DNA-binding NarL/FixJ family response regulator